MNTYESPASFSAFYAALLAGWPELPDNAKTAELAIGLMVTLDRACAAERSSLPPVVDEPLDDSTGLPPY